MTHEEEQIEGAKKLLRSTFSPADQGLRRDLWPQMLYRLQEAPVRLPWYDWALIALVGCWALVMPVGILQLLYQF